MWKQAAEDFAPFDVNVTTQDPGQAAITRSGSGDEIYGTRVVITVDNFDNCGCGGFAYLRAFDDTSDYYKPAFVFNTSLVGAGEAISHETGHNLGLNHDGVSGGANYYQGHGSGDTGWAPIMGAGYYQPLVQWSKGEYSSANNTEDDIARMQTYGAPLMSDDHGDSSSAATALEAATDGTTVSLSGTGMIRRREDVDVFSFVSGAGNYAINVDPAPFSPNLDIFAELRDSTGNLIASSNPVDSLPAALSGTLSAGEYFLSVDGVGKGDPQGTGYSDYGSLGRYTVTGTVADAGGLAAPVAVAAAPTYIAAIAPLTVDFNGSGSTDSDGSIVDWQWDFGDGNSDSGQSVNHTFYSPGTYAVSLTVTDNDGLSDNDSLSVVVLNQAPIAVASSDSTSGTAPVTIDFDGTGSSDPDTFGSIVSYAWDFGDGASSSVQNPSHTYTAGGNFSASLTVTDDLGASGSDTMVLDITAPAYVDQYASSEVFGAGTVSGTYISTHDVDGNEQSIRERESGGKKTRRYSYLEHTWAFNVQPGNAVTLFLTGSQDSSSDNDQMLFAYSVDGGAFVTLGGFSDVYGVPLPATGGQVRIRVNDSDRNPGNRALDTVYVDQILIRTDSQGGGSTAPFAATLNTATAMSSSQINIAWSDNSDDEFGFRIERSSDGSNWAVEDTVAANQVSFSDTGLLAGSTYYYRVVAYNAANDPVPSNEMFATTDEAGDISLTADGYKVKGVKHVVLSWTGLGSGTIYRDGVEVASGEASPYDDNTGSKGAGTYTYQVCTDDLSSSCSNQAVVVF